MYRATPRVPEIAPEQQIFQATNLHDVTHDDAVDDLGRDLARGQRGSSGMFRQVGGREILQQSPVSPKGSALGCNDEHTCRGGRDDPQ